MIIISPKMIYYLLTYSLDTVFRQENLPFNNKLNFNETNQLKNKKGVKLFYRINRIRFDLNF